MEDKTITMTSQETMEKANDVKVPESDTKVVNSSDKSKYDTKGIRLYTHKFDEPFTYENNTYTKIDFNFGNLKGKDATSIEDELGAEGRYTIAPEISDVYLSKIAVRASNPTISFDAMEELPYVDFRKIINAARTFLVKSGL